MTKRWEKLREAIPRIEQLEEERVAVNKDIEKLERERDTITKEMDTLYMERAGVELHVGAILKIIAMRRMGPADRQLEDAHLGLYLMVLAGTQPPQGCESATLVCLQNPTPLSPLSVQSSAART